MKGLMLAAVGGAMVFPASAAADNTPAGPATLMNEWVGPTTLEGYLPSVLVAVKIVVGPGGQPGTIRVRAAYPDAKALGDPVQLPAEPGTYTFPAPHIFWNPHFPLGIDQVTGGHAVVAQSPCASDAGPSVDVCALQHVNVFTPPGSEGGPTQVLRGAKLAITGVYETDLDRDLLGDMTEDRTDLKITGVVPRRTAVGMLQIAVTIANQGPLAADLPQLWTSLPDAKFGACRFPTPPWSEDGQTCWLSKPLAAGTSRTVTITENTVDAVAAKLTLTSEGPDLADSDNTARVHAPAATGLALTTRKSQHLGTGVKVQVVGIRSGRALVVAAFRRGGKTVKVSRVVTLRAGHRRSVTLRATGPKLRSLRRLAGTRPLRASVTARTFDGTYDARTTTTVRP